MAHNDNGFVPSLENARDYRYALGQFGTGVAIVTCAAEPVCLGITINSFASVSLEPALVLWSLSKTSRRFLPFEQAKHYAIHVLQSDQLDLAFAFSKNSNAFDQCEWEENENGVKVIKNTLARFDCCQEAKHDGGDHTIIVGQVKNVVMGQGAPLLFSQGQFGGFKGR